MRSQSNSNQQYGSVVHRQNNHRVFLHNLIMQQSATGQPYLEQNQQISAGLKENGASAANNNTTVSGLYKSNKYLLASGNAGGTARQPSMSVGGDTIASGLNDSALGGEAAVGGSKGKGIKQNKKSRTSGATHTSGSYQLQQSSKKANYPQASTIKFQQHGVADSQRYKQRQPPFIPSVTQNKGQNNINASDLLIDQNGEQQAVGRFHLQDILDEVASIEQKFTNQNDQSEIQDNNMENHANKAINNPLNNQNILVASTRDFRENPANKHCGEEPLPKYKGGWHKKQQSMKITSMGVPSQNVISPRRISNKRHSSNKQAYSQSANTYITYKQSNNHHHPQDSRGDAGRKSTNLPVRVTSNNRKNTKLVSSDLLAQNGTRVIPDQQVQKNHNGIVKVGVVAKMMAATPKKTLNSIDVHDVQQRQLAASYGGDQHSSVRLLQNEQSGKLNSTYRVTNLSSQVNQQIKTDQEHFGSFMIATSGANSLTNQRFNSGQKQASTTKSTNMMVNSSHGTGYNINKAAAAADYQEKSRKVIPLLSPQNQINVMQGCSSMEPLVNQQLLNTNVIPPSTAADDRTILRFEDLQNLAVDDNGGANESHIQEGATVAAAAAEREVLTPPALESLSPDVRQPSEKQRTLIGAFANGGEAPQSQLQANGNNVNVNFNDQNTDPLVQDILKGHQKLGRTLNRDSALAIDDSTNSKNLQSQSHYGDFGGGRDYLDKRSQMTTQGRDRRPSKSPMPAKKISQNNYSNPNGTTQKQSLKQLGLSYGILAKQDTHNKLVSSKNKRGSKSKAAGVSTDYQQQSSPHKRSSKTNKGVSSTANKAGVLDQVYFVNAPMGQEITLEGNQIVSRVCQLAEIAYDQQTALSPINELTQQVQTTQLAMRSTAQSHARLTQSSYFGQKSDTTKTHQLAVLNTPSLPSKLQSSQQKKLPSNIVQQIVQNQSIMKRMPELQMAPTIAPGGYHNQSMTQTQRGRMFKYQVMNGNNAALIKRVMTETRSYLWTEMTNNQQSHFHFRWSPGSRQVNFERLSHNFGQMVNHFEHHHEITTKNELFKNLKSYNDDKQQNAFYTIPLTFCLKISADRQAQSIKQQMKPFKEVFNLLEEFKENCNPDQPSQINQEPSTESLLDKIRPYDQVISDPMSVMITKKGQDSGYRDLISNAHGDGGQRIKRFTSRSSGLIMPMCHFVGQNIWILKPTSFNRGKGIHVVNSISKLKKLIKEYSRGKEVQSTALTAPTSTFGHSTVYPTSKFIEPQAMNTQQMLTATMQQSKTGPPSRQSQALANVSQSAQVTSKFLAQSKTKDISNNKGLTPSRVKGSGGASLSEFPMSVSTITKPSSPRNIDQVQQSDDTITTGDNSKLASTVILQAKKTSTGTNVLPTQSSYQKPSIRSQTFIIQKYIERPLLVNERKFDIRVWVTLTQDLDIYFFREGYLRTSSQPYSMSAQNLDDDFVHLTNNAIQKNSADYGQHEDGNQMSFADLKKLIQKSGTKVDFETDIVEKMKYLCALTLQTIRKKINPNRRKHCFELFGFDYFIDQDYNVFLIEVNTNPCLEESSRLLTKLLPRMLDDLFKLTIDQIYLPTKDLVQQINGNHISHNGKQSQPHSKSDKSKDSNFKFNQNKSSYPVSGYKDNINMWEKISTLKSSSSSTPIFVNNPFLKQLTKSERLIHLVNQHEMRVARPDLIEKSMKRDMQQIGGSSQLSGLIDY